MHGILKGLGGLLMLALLAAPGLRRPGEGAAAPIEASSEAGAGASSAGVREAWVRFLREHALSCPGDPELRLPSSLSWAVGPYRFEVLGARATIGWRERSPHPGQVRLGVLSGIKEMDERTRAALERFLVAFREAEVDAVLVGGDSGTSSADLEAAFSALGASGLPVLVIAGNNESRSRLHRALAAAAGAYPNVLNLDIVRVVQGAGFGVVSLPGYHLRAFSGSGASCLFGEEAIRALPALLETVEGARVLLAHGPPRGRGKVAVDFVDAETGNVGSEALARVVREARPRLVVAGHILESGLRATERSGRAVPPGRARRSLVLNPGQVSALPYQLSSGKVVYGTAALVTMDAKRVSWRRLEAPAWR